MSRVLSILLARGCACHLSGCDVTVAIYRPTLRSVAMQLKRAAFRLRYTRTFNLRGAQPGMSPSGWWSLTPPSHPYHFPERKWRLFSSTLLYPCGQLPVKKQSALCCPDFPLISPRIQATDCPATFSKCKVSASREKYKAKNTFFAFTSEAPPNLGASQSSASRVKYKAKNTFFAERGGR